MLRHQLPKLNNDQRAAYDTVLAAVMRDAGGVFFVNGPGGTGKTFLYNTLLLAVRANGSLALPVASSGIAALLMAGGRTAHSTFKIPVPITGEATCRIRRGGSLAQRIKDAKLII